MGKPRYLTKSRFKIGCECPTKLYFTGKAEFGNTKLDNPFLQALAEGGFQVGELAKLYHPGGTEVETLDVEAAVRETESLLQREVVTIYEAALKFKDLLVRVDVLRKNGDSVELIEVKAKSFDAKLKDQFYNKRSLKQAIPKLSSEWEPYLSDVAFQVYVARGAFPKWKITSALMLADKNAKASVDGLNQIFFLAKDAKGRSRVELTRQPKRSELGDDILVKVSVDSEVKLLHDNGIDDVPFEKLVRTFADAYGRDEMLSPKLSNQCKSCEFRISEDLKGRGLKSGFEECWKKVALLGGSDFSRSFLFDVWNFRKSEKLITDGRYFMDQLTEDDVSPRPNEDKPGLSSSQRQWLQVQKVQEKDTTPFIDREGLSGEFAQWKFPLHFIDFETTMAAIPFNKGRRPYEQIAFQFSHHIVTETGQVAHQTQYINTERGHFPNFDFVRTLRQALSNDAGTIFRFAAHENTVLSQIRNQLRDSQERDRTELMEWIQTVTTSTDDSTESWDGNRSMVDMCELVKRYFYHPLTKGSNSIKKVLPAVLATSEYLKARYSKPIYGSQGGVTSLNYRDWQWIKPSGAGAIVDPYKLLPPVFSDLDLETMDSLVTDGSIADGGAAMTAYARMQFTQMGDEERRRVVSALLKYCELDTLAMVMIYEYWANEALPSRKKRAA